MFPALFTALILLGVAYIVYKRLDPINSKEFKELEKEKDTLIDDILSLENENSILHRENIYLKGKNEQLLKDLNTHKQKDETN